MCVCVRHHERTIEEGAEEKITVLMKIKNKLMMATVVVKEKTHKVHW